MCGFIGDDKPIQLTDQSVLKYWKKFENIYVFVYYGLIFVLQVSKENKLMYFNRYKKQISTLVI